MRNRFRSHTHTNSSNTSTIHFISSTLFELIWCYSHASYADFVQSESRLGNFLRHNGCNLHWFHTFEANLHGNRKTRFLTSFAWNLGGEHKKREREAREWLRWARKTLLLLLSIPKRECSHWKFSISHKRLRAKLIQIEMKLIDRSIEP